MENARLPDEIIREILAPGLYVADDAFASTLNKSPFAEYELTTSMALLVCKSWLRVATPLLYHTVVLRSKAQAHVLAWALKSNPQLGLFIRKIRVEGGFGASMFTIFKHAPNITDLWMSLILYSSDSPAGFERGLQFINPRRLILWDDHSDGNACRKKVCKALVHNIKTWTNLVTFEFGDPVEIGENWQRLVDITNALIAHCKIRHVRVLETWFFPEWLLPLLQLSTIQEIQVKSKRNPEVCLWDSNDSDSGSESEEYETPFKRTVRENQSLKAKVIYMVGSKPTNLMPGLRDDVPTYSPLSHVSDDTRTQIWQTVIWHAAHFTTDEEIANFDAENFRWPLRQEYTAQLLLVSKAFYKAGLPLLYRCPVIRSPVGLVQFTKTLKNYGKYVRMINLCILLESNVFRLIVGRTPNLILLTDQQHKRKPEDHISCDYSIDWPGQSIPSIQWADFKYVAQTTGQSLLHMDCPVLDVSSDNDLNLPAFIEPFSNFKYLRSLIWVDDVPITFTERNGISGDALSCLQVLSYACPGSFDETSNFLSFLGCLQLPSLQDVRFPEPDRARGGLNFLKVHGQKLKSLCLRLNGISGLFSELCPNLEEFHLPGAVESINKHVLERNGPTSSLRKIMITSALWQWEGSMKRLALKNFDFLNHVDFSLFEVIEEIQIRGFNWPVDQHGIERSPWPAFAEMLLDKWNLKLTDSQGKAWRPRLKPVRQVRRQKQSSGLDSEAEIGR